eukprot:UN03419
MAVVAEHLDSQRRCLVDNLRAAEVTEKHRSKEKEAAISIQKNVRMLKILP